MAEGPIIPNAKVIALRTGNILECDFIKPNILKSPTEELTDCLTYTLKEWKSTVDLAEIKAKSEIDSYALKGRKPLPADKRDTFKITLKICLFELNVPCVAKAIESALDELGTSSIETVLLSVPQHHHNIDDISPVWRCLEGFVDDNKVYMLGVSDLDLPVLTQLNDFAKVKPCINQVNLDTCCVIPDDLIAYAKANDIQLLTHNDPPNLLPCKNFRALMTEGLSAADSDGWKPRFISRYSVMIKTRGVLQAKGYIVKATR